MKLKLSPKWDKRLTWFLMFMMVVFIVDKFTTDAPMTWYGWLGLAGYLIGFRAEIAFGDNPNRAIVRLRWWVWRWHQWRNHRAYVAFCDHSAIADALVERWWPEMAARQKKEAAKQETT